MLSSVRGANILKIRKTPRSQTLAPQGPKKREEEHTHKHTVKAHLKQDRTGSRLTYAKKEGVERGGGESGRIFTSGKYTRCTVVSSCTF